ncbi:hypothetical protein LJC24_01265 [Desulfococcaceae bacterium OttesenSCG-928-F15]|nr:hypothetical protein [Desulfococcaceae bacterium OttesenSCG-928-F15]
MTKESHYQKLEILFADLNPHLAPILSDDELAEAMESVDYNEFGIALEVLYFILEDGKTHHARNI